MERRPCTYAHGADTHVCHGSSSDSEHGNKSTHGSHMLEEFAELKVGIGAPSLPTEVFVFSVFRGCMDIQRSQRKGDLDGGHSTWSRHSSQTSPNWRTELCSSSCREVGRASQGRRVVGGREARARSTAHLVQGHGTALHCLQRPSYGSSTPQCMSAAHIRLPGPNSDLARHFCDE